MEWVVAESDGKQSRPGKKGSLNPTNLSAIQSADPPPNRPIREVRSAFQ